MKNCLSCLFAALLLVLAPGLCRGQAAARPATRYGHDPQAGHYALVNGLRLYYEEYGSGPTLLLLHGNGGSIAAQTSRINRFRSRYRVIAVDSRGQGQSVDNTTRLTYDLMASDVAKLLDQLKIDSCLVFGQSDGGILGLLLARDYPRKVRRLAVFGANLQPDSLAVEPAIVRLIQDSARLASSAKSRQLNALMVDQPRIALADLARIRVPVLVMSGDRDAIRLPHTVQLYQHLPRANLFVMPGASHFGSYEKTPLFLSVLTDFFEQPFRRPDTAVIMGARPRS